MRESGCNAKEGVTSTFLFHGQEDCFLGFILQQKYKDEELKTHLDYSGELPPRLQKTSILSIDILTLWAGRPLPYSIHQKT